MYNDLNWEFGFGTPIYDTPRYLAAPTIKSCRLLITFSLIMYPLPHILVLIVHLVHFMGWMGQGDHSKTSLL